VEGLIKKLLTSGERYGIINMSRGSRDNRLKELIGEQYLVHSLDCKDKNEEQSRKQPIDSSKTLYRLVVANTTEK
jgi:hypothetical protein